MSWPTDGLPRFKVASVTGFSNVGSNNAKAATKWTVLDRAYCHAIVWQQQLGKGGAHRREDFARALARTLNEGTKGMED